MHIYSRFHSPPHFFPQKISPLFFLADFFQGGTQSRHISVLFRYFSMKFYTPNPLLQIYNLVKFQLHWTLYHRENFKSFSVIYYKLIWRFVCFCALLQRLCKELNLPLCQHLQGKQQITPSITMMFGCYVMCFCSICPNACNMQYLFCLAGKSLCPFSWIWRFSCHLYLATEALQETLSHTSLAFAR